MKAGGARHIAGQDWLQRVVVVHCDGRGWGRLDWGLALGRVGWVGMGCAGPYRFGTRSE